MGEAAALFAAALWAIASVLFANAGRSISAAALNLTKSILGLALLAGTLVATTGAIDFSVLSASELTWLAASGVIGLTIGDTAFFAALVSIGARRALVLWSLVPPITAVLAWGALGEALTAPMGVGIALTIGGVTWVVLERTQDGGASPAGGVSGAKLTLSRAGLAFGLLAAWCQASGNVMTKLGGHAISALEISVVRLGFGCAGLCLQLLLSRRLGEVRAVFFDRRLAAMIIAATIFGTYLGLWLSMAGLRYAYAGVAATLNSTSPIFVLPIAAIFSKERVSPRAIFGAVVAVAGVAVLFLF